MLHFIRIACFMVLRDTGDGGFGVSPSFKFFEDGSFVSLATIEKSENKNYNKIKMPFIQQESSIELLYKEFNSKILRMSLPRTSLRL